MSDIERVVMRFRHFVGVLCLVKPGASLLPWDGKYSRIGPLNHDSRSPLVLPCDAAIDARLQ